jgi:hypothetical protein
MPRRCERAWLESGLKLDINRLALERCIRTGGISHGQIQWTSNYWGEIASAAITVDMRDKNAASLVIQMGALDQKIVLEGASRHFGGQQWYFVCPYLNRLCSVLWMPPGARSFACRQRWGRSVAYTSQFLDRDNRAHRGKSKIRGRLCSIGGFDPDEWDFPPKPKWMRWHTYRRAEEKFERYDAGHDEGLIGLAAKLGIKI